MTEKNSSDLEFPVECHFRIIAHDLPNIYFVIETVLMELGVTAPLEEANTSAGGKYVSYAVSTIVDTRDALEEIDRELRNIVGVKMVM